LAKNVQKKPSKNPDDLVKPVSRQLEQSELEQVSGGKVTMSDFHFVKKVDKASPQ
jgi:type VI protein secretion system component Hcp